MCLAAIAHGMSLRFPWVLASNRDEFFARPSAALDWWSDESAINTGQRVLGGRDLQAGGSWLAVTERGRLALVTNVREPGRHDPLAPSRGDLVLQALQRGAADAAWLSGLRRSRHNGFNLLLAELGDPGELGDLGKTPLHWTSNRSATDTSDASDAADGPRPGTVGPGVVAVSNALLDTPWPKLTRLKQDLQTALATASGVQELSAALLAALARDRIAPDAELPRTGVPLEHERQLSPAFIRITAAEPAEQAIYGTRCSTLLIVEQEPATGHRRCHVLERRFDSGGQVAGQSAFDWLLQPG